MAPNYLEIGDDGVARPGGPRGRDVKGPTPIVLGLSDPKRGMIGQSTLVDVGETVTIIDWQIDDDNSAVPVTLMLGIPNRADSLASNPIDIIRVHARVKYGIGGAQNEILLDVVPGNAITLTATFIRVEVISDDTSTGPVTVSAFLARFAIAHPPSKFTRFSIAPILPGAGVLRGVPSLARSVKVYANDGGNPTPWSVRFIDAAAQTIARFDFAGGVSNSGELELPGDCFFVQIANTGAVFDLVTWRMLFDLY